MDGGTDFQEEWRRTKGVHRECPQIKVDPQTKGMTVRLLDCMNR